MIQTVNGYALQSIRRVCHSTMIKRTKVEWLSSPHVHAAAPQSVRCVN